MRFGQPEGRKEIKRRGVLRAGWEGAPFQAPVSSPSIRGRLKDAPFTSVFQAPASGMAMVRKNSGRLESRPLPGAPSYGRLESRPPPRRSLLWATGKSPPPRRSLLRATGTSPPPRRSLLRATGKSPLPGAPSYGRLESRPLPGAFSYGRLESRPLLWALEACRSYAKLFLAMRKLAPVVGSVMVVVLAWGRRVCSGSGSPDLDRASQRPGPDSPGCHDL